MIANFFRPKLSTFHCVLTLAFSVAIIGSAQAADNPITCNTTTCNNTGTVTISNSTFPGIKATTNSTTITNSGQVNASGSNTIGIQTLGSESIIINTGSVSATGTGTVGLYSGSSLVNISNIGSVRLTGNNGKALYFYTGSGGSITNAGTLISSGTGGSAIYINTLASNIIITLNEGSILVGSIDNESSSQATLNLNLGSAQSYHYTLTGAGSWSVSDLDHRPFFNTGTTVTAAGIGLQELGPELLFERTNLVNQILYRNSERMVAKSSGTPYDQELWFEPYGAHYSRLANDTDPLVTQYSKNIGGAALGFKLGVDSHLHAILSIDHSKLNIDRNAHILESNTLMFGFFGPQLYHMGPFTFSPKILGGYTQNKGNRAVLVGTGSGSETVTSTYVSYLGLVGMDGQYTLEFTKSTRAKLIANLDFSGQSDAAYQESAYFSWNLHTLTQVSGGLNLELAHTTDNEKTTFYASAGMTKRKLLSGSSTSYIIDGMSTNFDGVTISDTYTSEHIGVQYAFVQSVLTYLDLSMSQSSNTIKNVQAMIGIGLGF